MVNGLRGMGIAQGIRVMGGVLCALSALAMILGSGPAPALVRIGAVVALFGLLLNWSAFSTWPGIRWALALTTWCALASAHANLFSTGLFESPGMILILPFAAYVGMVVWQNSQVDRRGEWPLILVFLVAIGVMTVQLAMGWNRDDESLFHVQRGAPTWTRASGFFYSHYSIGLFISALTLYLSSPARRQWPLVLRAVIFLVGFVGVLYSSSRMCMVAFVAGAMVMAFPHTWRRASILLLLIPLLLGGCYLYLTHARPGMIDQALNLSDSRFPMWAVQRDLILQHPWFGVGGSTALTVLSNDLYASSPQYGTPEFPGGIPESHNGFIGYAVYFGIPATIGWIFWLGALGWSFIRGRASGMDDALLGCALLVVMVVASMGSMLPQDIGAAPLLYLLVGTCWGRMQANKSTSLTAAPRSGGAVTNGASAANLSVVVPPAVALNPSGGERVMTTSLQENS